MQIPWSASHILLGIAPQEQPPDHYRLLGLGRLELNADAIVYAAERQSDQLKRFTSGEHGETAIALLAAVSSARDCLLDHDLHRIYAGRLQGFDPDSNDLDTKSAWRSFAEEFDEAWSRSQTLEFEAQHYWLGIPRHQRPASNCRLLGISEGELNADVVQSAAERQISFVRKFASGDKATDANTLLQQLSRARSTLLRIASDSPPDHASDPGHTDLLDEHVEILPPEPEVELFDEVPASDPRWVSANTIDDPLANVSTPPPQTSVIDDSQPLVVRQRSRKGRARFTIRAMVFALLILSSHSLIGYFGYQLLLAEPESEPTSEIARFEPQRGAGMREPTERGRAQSAQTLPRHAPSPPAGGVTADVQQATTRKAEFAETLALANDADPAKINLVELDRAEALAHSISEQAMVRAVRTRLARWEESRQRDDTQSFLSQLSSLETQIDQIEKSTEAGNSGDGDAGRVLDLIERVSKLEAAFPNPSDEAADEAAELNQRAGALLRTVSSLPREDTTGRDQMTEASPTPKRNPASSDEEPQYATSRTWTTTSGMSFEARVSKLGRDRVVFRRTSDGREGEVQIANLVADDQRSVLVSYFNEQDRDQLQGTQVYVEQIASTPKDASEPLKQHHINFSDSPYGGLWAAVCLVEGENRTAEAARILLQVIKRIEHQQQTDPNRHAMTLASACNDLAVCKIREYDADAAAVHLVRALKSMPRAMPSVLHNALTLQQLGETPTPPWTLKNSSRSNLNNALTVHSSYHDALPIGWYYCLQVDLPASRDESHTGEERRYLGQSSVTGHTDPLVIPNGWCLACGGMGFNSCTYGNCVKGAITVKKRLQVGTNALTGDPIYGAKNFKQRCPNCNGAGGFDCRHCEKGRLP